MWIYFIALDRKTGVRRGLNDGLLTKKNTKRVLYHLAPAKHSYKWIAKLLLLLFTLLCAKPRSAASIKSFHPTHTKNQSLMECQKWYFALPTFPSEVAKTTFSFFKLLYKIRPSNKHDQIPFINTIQIQVQGN